MPPVTGEPQLWVKEAGGEETGDVANHEKGRPPDEICEDDKMDTSSRRFPSASVSKSTKLFDKDSEQLGPFASRKGKRKSDSEDTHPYFRLEFRSKDEEAEDGETNDEEAEDGEAEHALRLQRAWVVHRAWASIENVCKFSSSVLVNKFQCEHIAEHFKVTGNVLKELGLDKDFVSGQALEGSRGIHTSDEMHFIRIARTFEERMKKSDRGESDMVGPSHFRTQFQKASSMFEDYVCELNARRFQGYSLWVISTKETVEARPRYRAQLLLDEFLCRLLGILKQGEDLVLFHSGLEGANNGVVERTGLYGEKFVEIHELLYKLLDFYACLEHCEGTQFARGYLPRLDSCGTRSFLYYLNSNCVGEYASLSIDDEFLNIELATTISKMLERPNCALKTLFLESSSGVKVDQEELRKCRLMVIAALSKCVSITSLTVRGSNGEEVHELCKSLSVNKVLNHLDISIAGSLGENDAMNLSAMLKENHSLTSFTLESAGICFEGIVYLEAMLVENSLQELCLRFRALNGIGLKHLMRPLMANKDGGLPVILSLKGCASFSKVLDSPMEEPINLVPILYMNKTCAHFSIQFMNLDPNATCEILDSIKNNKTFQVLDFQGCSNFGNNSEVATCLEALLAENSTLEELKVDLSKWDKFYLKHLLRPLMANKDGEPYINISLRRLHILNCNCKQGWDLIESIAQMLRTNTMLSHFCMIDASLNTFDVCRILDSLKINKTLQVLNLDKCKGLNDALVKIAFMDLLVNYNFSLSTIRMHGLDWDIKTFMKWELEPLIKTRNLWSLIGGTLESPIVHNVYDLKQAIATPQLEKGEGSTKVGCGSSVRAVEKHKLEVEAKDERPRLFLSYSHKMRDFAMRLCMELKSSSYNIVDQNSINFDEVMDQCQLTIVVLSNTYVNSEQSMLELQTIVKSKRANNPTLKVYPLFYKLTLKDLQYVYDSTSTFGRGWNFFMNALRKEALKFLIDRKNKVSKKANDLVDNLSQGRVDVGKFCEQFNEVLRSSWPSNGLEFEKNATFEEEYVCAILEEIFLYMPVVKECNNDQISRHQCQLEMESKLSLRQMKPLLESLLMKDFCLRRELNMAQHLQQKYIQYSSFQEMCPLNLRLDQKNEYSKGRIVATLFPTTFLFHFKVQMLRGRHDDNLLSMLKVVAELVAQKIQQECNENGVQTSTFFDFVDFGAPLDPRKKTIAMCKNFSTKTFDGSKQLVIVQDDLSGAYYYQCDEALDLGNLALDKSIGVIGVQVTSTEIHVDNIQEDGSSYSGVLGDFSYKVECNKNKQCVAKAFGDLEGARFLSKNCGLKCSPLLIIALANAIQKKGLTLTWSNGKGHMEFYPNLPLEVEACACQIAYNGNINQLGVEIEWGTNINTCALHNQTNERGTNEIVSEQEVLGSNVDRHLITSNSKDVVIASIDGLQNQIAIYGAATQSKSKRSLGIKVGGTGIDASYKKHDSKAKQLMIIAANNILKNHYELEGGFERVLNLDVEHPNLESLLCRCQLHEVHNRNYLVVSNVHLTSHVSIYQAIEKNEPVPKFELTWITDILIEGGEKQIKNIFETGLKGRELIVNRKGSKFTEPRNLSRPLVAIVPGYQKSLLKIISGFASNAITSSMIEILEPDLVGMLKSKNEWEHIIGPHGEYAASHKYWWNATFMQAIVYSRTMYKSGKLLKTCIEVPINVIGHIGFCSIEKDPKNKFEHLCTSVVSRGKFSRPGSLSDKKVLWGGLEIEQEELANLCLQ